MKLGLYVITDEGISHGLSHVEIARKVAEGGADVIQLRDKARTGKDMLSIALKIREIAHSSGPPSLSMTVWTLLWPPTLTVFTWGMRTCRFHLPAGFRPRVSSSVHP